MNNEKLKQSYEMLRDLGNEATARVLNAIIQNPGINQLRLVIKTRTAQSQISSTAARLIRYGLVDCDDSTAAVFYTANSNEIRRLNKVLAKFARLNDVSLRSYAHDLECELVELRKEMEEVA